MLKKFIIISLFLIVPFFNFSPKFVIAQSTSDTTEQQSSQTDWQQFWSSILNLFTSLRSDIKLSFSKEYPISCQPKTKFTDYNASDQDINSRAQAQSVQEYRKGSYLRAILDGQFSDDIITHICNGTCSDTKIDDSCTDIRYSTLVYFFYKKGEKILYDKDDHKTPIDYDPAKMDSYNYTLPANSDTYFKNLYNNISQIPRGAFQGEPNTAGSVSQELGDSLRTMVPAKNQLGSAPATLKTQDDAKQAITNNDLKKRTLYTNFIPAKYIPQNLKVSSDKKDTQTLGVNSNQTATLQELFRVNLLPKVQQTDEEDAPEREDENNDCNAEKSHCRGMSQYGALGMALAGKSYEEILKAYYGNIKLVKLSTFTKNPYIQVDISDGSCDTKTKKVTTMKVQIEQYLYKLGELPSYLGDLGDTISKGQHEGINVLKAQAIAARTYAFVKTAGFTKSICNTARCQVFRCNMGVKPNFNIAVNQTASMIMVDATTGKPFNAQYARTFCGPSKIYTSNFMNATYTSVSYDGRAYETAGLVATKKDPDQWCIVK